jgi:anti-anti-sigma factor
MNENLILIVDDEDQICAELDGYLMQKGYQTITANNGYDAFDLFVSEMPICILTDYRMPVMDGIELLKKIKLLNKDVHVILISGQADVKVVVEAMKNEAFDFLSKPVDLKNLITLVDIAVNKTIASIRKHNDGRMTSTVYHKIVENNNDVSVLFFNKDLDERMKDKFSRYVTELLNDLELRRIVIFNLENAKYINNIGLNFLIEMQKLLQESGKKLFLCSVGGQVLTYIKTLGYDNYFKIEMNVGNVLEHVRLNNI